MRTTSHYILGALAAVAALGMGSARASLIADGITYTLTQQTTGSPTTDQFTLSITGINAAADTEGGRSGVQSFAFTPATGFVTASPPTGYSLLSGGLNSMGCNGSGNFFCFAAVTTPPSTPALAANSSLSFTFTETVAVASDFTGYAPDFKINWVGSKNNYDLVSKQLTPTVVPVPEPASLALISAGLFGVGLVGWRRRGQACDAA